MATYKLHEISALVDELGMKHSEGLDEEASGRIFGAVADMASRFTGYPAEQILRNTNGGPVPANLSAPTTEKPEEDDELVGQAHEDETGDDGTVDPLAGAGDVSGQEEVLDEEGTDDEEGDAEGEESDETVAA